MLQKVYSADGVEHTVESVDAREYVATGGYSFEPPERGVKLTDEAAAAAAAAAADAAAKLVAEAAAAAEAEAAAKLAAEAANKPGKGGGKAAG